MRQALVFGVVLGVLVCSIAAPTAQIPVSDDELVRSLNGVRFDCPDLVNNQGRRDQERKEYWFVINGRQLNSWIRFLQIDPDRASVDRVGQVIRAASVPITGAVAREGGPNWEEVYRISSSQVVREGKLDGRPKPIITCVRH